MKIIIFSFLFVYFFLTILSFYQPLENNVKLNTNIAVLIDEKTSIGIPKKEDGYHFEKIECNEKVVGSWDHDLWNLKLSNLSNSGTKCNLFFKKGSIGETWNYKYTGSTQHFLVPYTGKYHVELWGAVAEGILEQTNGKGAYTSGEIKFHEGENYYIQVGGKYGYNGGSIINNYKNNNEIHSGGASDIRLVKEIWDDITGLRSRIMVAGGGGRHGHGGFGGDAGTLKGIDGIPNPNPSYTGLITVGYGGTQISGGLQGFHKWVSNAPTAGTFGKGGNGENDYGPSGGGGYYGGGGGSSYISGFIGCIAITSITNETPKVTTYQNISDSHHYSGNVFINAFMKAGNESMPTIDGKSTMIGNADNGHARITYLGNS